MRPDLMVSDPDAALPGDRVALSFPDETPRGLGFALEQEVGDAWILRAYLTIAPADGPPDEPAWYEPDESPAWDSLEIGGPGPDIIVIPDDTEPGSYRVCTVNALQNFCTPISIEG